MNSFFNKCSVAIIGSSSTLEEIGDQSKYLKNFDTIVRFNGAVPLTKKIAEYTTDHTDVLYCNILNEVTGKSDALKYISQFRCAAEAYKSDKFCSLLPLYADHIDRFELINPACVKGLQPHIANTFPNTGLMAMCEVLMNKPKLVYLTGFSFWKNGTGHFEGYESKESERIRKAGGNIHVHKQEPQFRYFKQHIANRKDVIMDAYLTRLCQK